MNPPGWYPDPAGVPNRLRFFDGAQWSEATTFDPATPFPTSPTPAAGPTGQAGAQPGGQAGAPGSTAPAAPAAGNPKKVLALIAAGVGLVLVIVAAVIFVPRMIGGTQEPPVITDPPPTQGGSSAPAPGPSGEQPGGEKQGTPGQQPPGKVECTGGNSVMIPESDTNTYSSAGATITLPAEWTFRFDKSQWTWMDDLASWGALVEPRKDDYAVGVTLGTLHNRNGFTEPKAAATAQLECLMSHGVFNDPSLNKWTEDSAEAVDVNGMKGWQLTGRMSHTQGTYESETVSIIVLDAGQPAALATIIAFAPTGDEKSEAQVSQALGTVKRA